jgi:peptidoglycan/xylan/chitin deacetylase (PgdA/CDA1 family)
MRYAGIGWGPDGYQVEIIDADGRRQAPARSFGPAHLGDLAGFLRGAGDRIAAVIDSTNGIVDGQLMAAGITVYRADPPLLPRRPAFGSVPALDIARAGLGSGVGRLRRDRGTQTGREDELLAVQAASATALDAQTAAGRALSHGDRGAPRVALTFDDGPQPPYTGRVLDILERYRVPATFFCVGLHAGAFPDELVAMREQGHQLGNHTFSHPFLHELGRSEVAAQVRRAGEAVARASGGEPPTVFRPPYGSRTPDVLGWLSELEPTTVLWDAEAADWAMPGAAVIAERILGQVRPGSVVLLHDGGGDRSQTVDALPVIIEGLLARGYEFVPVAAFDTGHPAAALDAENAENPMQKGRPIHVA